MIRRTCGNCLFWAMDKNNLQKGNCRYLPPVLFPLQVSAQEIRFMSKWPTTERDDKACSKYEDEGTTITPDELGN